MPLPFPTRPCTWPLLPAPTLCLNQLIWFLGTKDLPRMCRPAFPYSADSWIPNPEGPCVGSGLENSLSLSGKDAFVLAPDFLTESNWSSWGAPRGNVDLCVDQASKSWLTRTEETLTTNSANRAQKRSASPPAPAALSTHHVFPFSRLSFCERPQIGLNPRHNVSLCQAARIGTQRPLNSDPQMSHLRGAKTTPLHSITRWNGCRSLGGVRGGVYSLHLGLAHPEAYLTGGPMLLPLYLLYPVAISSWGCICLSPRPQHSLPTNANVRRGMCSLVGRSFLPTVSPRHPERRTQGVVYISVSRACGQWEVHRTCVRAVSLKVHYGLAGR